MGRRPRRNHSPAFKSEVALAVIKGEHTLAGLAQKFYVHPTRLHSGKFSCLSRPRMYLSRTKRKSRRSIYKTLHAKIGELTLENDFLESAPTKAGLLSAKK